MVSTSDYHAQNQGYDSSTYDSAMQQHHVDKILTNFSCFLHHSRYNV